MRPKFRNTQTDDLQMVRRDVADMADLFGELAGAKDLGNQTIGTTSTAIAHGLGAPPRWITYGRQANATIWQAAVADTKFVYLIASAPVVAGVVVF